MSPATDQLAAFVAGFVAAEGCFTATRGGTKFAFQVGLGATDRQVCHELRGFFAVGSVIETPRREAHYDDEVVYVVRSAYDHIAAIVPFMDAHLPPSYKREQYLAWRERLFDYWDHGMKRRRPCTIDGCDAPQRGKGLCRHHFYRRYGR